jgi:16S rRNA (cytosine967-C5)-methyltransferase
LRDGGRLSAAIEVLTDVETRRRPVRLALKAWGDAARYAGAKDRAFVSGLVLDVLRRRRSLAWRMADEGVRAVVLGALAFDWAWSLERIAEAAADAPHGPGALTDAERAALGRPRDLDAAPPAVRGDYPDWLQASLERVFGADAPLEGAALAERAPVDLRINTLKTDPEQALKALSPLRAQPAGLLPTAVRIAAPDPTERGGAVETIPAFSKGWFEVQDLASQIAASAAGDIVGRQVLDLCAGGGGKTLALSAAMENKGQIHAYDADRRRLAPIIERLRRAGTRNVQVHDEAGALGALEGRMDRVLVDAPCTGTGTWRRRPDTKWRLTEKSLAERTGEQDAVLAEARRFVRPGGLLVYVTCSVLPQENDDRIAAFLDANPDFAPHALAAAWQDRLKAPLPSHRPDDTSRFVLTPATTGTDGFFIAALRRGE